MGEDLYAWTVTFSEPATSAYSVSSFLEEGDGTTNTSTLLGFPLLYGGGVDSGDGLDLGTLGTDSGLNVTRIHRGTLGPFNGGVSTKCFNHLMFFIAHENFGRIVETDGHMARCICFLPTTFCP